MSSTLKIKTGATFSVAFLALLPTGTWTADCDIRKGDDTLIGAPVVTLSPLSAPDADGNTHAGLIEATSAQTALWPPGAARADVRFTDTSVVPVVLTSDPFGVSVEKAVTHD